MLRIGIIIFLSLFTVLSSSCLQKDEPAGVEAEGAAGILKMASTEPDSIHGSNYADAYNQALSGNPQYGLELIDQAQKADTSTRASAYYYKYLVYSLLENQDSARVYRTKYYVALTEETALNTINRQQEFYEAQAMLLKQKRAIAMRNIAIAFLLLAGILGVLVWQNKRKKEELNRKAGDLLALAEELKAASVELETLKGINSQMLSKNEESLERLRNRFTDLFQAQFKVLERLYVAFNTPDSVRQDAVFGETSQLLKVIKSDDEKQHRFEQYLNDELDGILEKFRSDYPGMKESDYKFFSYLITGFSARTVASLTGFTTGSVYTKKNALKTTIAKSDSLNKDLYLRYL